MPTWMLIEDEADIRNVVKVMFQVWGYDVIEFASGHDTMKFLDEVDNGEYDGELPALTLSDIRLPGPNGNEIAHRIRRSPVLKDIPIILMTAFQLSESEQVAFRTNDGVNRIIFKPLPEFDKFHQMLLEVADGTYRPPI